MYTINDQRYAFRKDYDYDDDVAILFYKGQKITKTRAENLRGSFIEESYCCKDMVEFVDDIGDSDCDVTIDEEDINNNWETIWDEMEWNADSKSYKYGNWEVIFLDI